MPKKKELTDVFEEIRLEEGLDIDIHEGWHKLISSQFGGNPGRGFSELIQNALDSYPNHLSWNEKRGAIETSEKSISITDFGEGLDRTRLKLLTTLGGTDKASDPNKIGKFGIGFVSIFNPKLKTKCVRVLTCCEGENVELSFDVTDPMMHPTIKAIMHPEPFPFSTRIIVEFEDETAVQQCLNDAKKRLEYYPCNITINKSLFQSIWQRAKQNEAIFFTEGGCYGFLDQKHYNKWITVMCKFEYLLKIPLANLLTGGPDTKNDLRDYYRKELPYLPQFSISINCNDLSVTISRDSFRLDCNYEKMVRTLADILMLELAKEIDETKGKEMIIANQYVLRNQLAKYLKKTKDNAPTEGKHDFVLKKLAEAKVHRMNGKSTCTSLQDINSKITDGLPLFFSPDKKNLRWVGGVFKHDFIILPQKCTINNGAPRFYDDLFTSIFEDVVNLDTIQEDQEKIKNLVDRKIVSQESLTPNTRLIGKRHISGVEKSFLTKINRIIKHPDVALAIKKNIHIFYDQAECVYFDSDGKDAYIATGLFAESGEALDDKMVLANLRQRNQQPEPSVVNKLDTLYIGILRRHQIIDFLIHCDDNHKEYYAITYLSHELALCQKHLVPYSDFYHVVKDRLADDVRKAVMSELLMHTQEGMFCAR